MNRARVKSRSSHLQPQDHLVQDEVKYFLLLESLSLGLAYLEALFFKFILVSEKKEYKGRSLSPPLKKSICFRRGVFLEDNKRPILKKGLRGRLAPVTSFLTKKNIRLHLVLGGPDVGDTPSKSCFEKKAKQKT